MDDSTYNSGGVGVGESAHLEAPSTEQHAALAPALNPDDTEVADNDDYQAAATNVEEPVQQFFGLRRRHQARVQTHTDRQEQQQQEDEQHDNEFIEAFFDDQNSIVDDDDSNDNNDPGRGENPTDGQENLRRRQTQQPGGGPSSTAATASYMAPDVMSFQTSPKYFLLSFLVVVIAIVSVSPPPNVHQLLFHASFDPQFVEYAKRKDGPFDFQDFAIFKEEYNRSKNKSSSNKRNNEKNNADKNNHNKNNNKLVQGQPPKDERAHGIVSSHLDSWLQPVLDHVWSFGYLSSSPSSSLSSSSNIRSSQDEKDPFSMGKKKAATTNEHRRDKRSKDPLSQSPPPQKSVQHQGNSIEWLYVNSNDWWRTNVMDPVLSYWYADYHVYIGGGDSSSLSTRGQKSTTGMDDSASKQDRSNKSKSKEDRRRTERNNHHRRSKRDGITGVLDNSKGSNIFFQWGVCQHAYYVTEQFIDPAILHPTPESTTDIIDKVLTSTPRLLAIANFMLALTYLLHSRLAAWFLGPDPQPRGNRRQQHQPQQQQQQGNLQQQGHNDFTGWSASNNAPNGDGSARERMGGFLVFKLLLISAVVSPDTFDLLILLTWYTTMSCLRSLDHLAHSTTMHLLALGQPPRKGVVQLLFWIFVSDSLAALSCVALFHDAGWGMVILLISDCALLACDIVQHILKHFATVLETIHSDAIQEIESRQLEIHNNQQSDGTRDNDETEDASNDWEILSGSNSSQLSRTQATTIVGAAEVQEGQRGSRQTPMDIQQESRRLDHQMELMELSHARKIAILDGAMFAFDLIGTLFQVFHFGHIWTMHGIQLTLIDGVLALHLQSSISSLFKKIATRRNLNSIARDLEGLFPDASDEELRKSTAAGDVCSICLGTMTTGGHVKKLKCSHLFHTHCLREVVERAQSINAAKCPLCRSSLVNGTRHGGSSTDLDQNRVVDQQGDLANLARGAEDIVRDRALFRFSTERFLPAWLPVPAFSFEVIQRSPLRDAAAGTPPAQEQVSGQPQPPAQPDGEQMQREETQETNRGIDLQDEAQEVADANANLQRQQQQHQEQQEPSFLRRFLVMAGVIPMSPEEEARAIEQLVDMFPQYNRSDLLRELRQRGSAEAVAEAILLGVFSGVPRGD